eukprot:1270072-Pyramimonas_sp.AAC.1
MSPTCLAVRRSELVWNSSSWDAGLKPNPLVVFLSFSEEALGASLVPVPGLRDCKQGFDSSQCSNPGRDLSTDTDPGGNARHATRFLQESHVDVKDSNDPLLLARCRAVPES